MPRISASPLDASLLRLAALAAIQDGGPQAEAAERALATLSSRPAQVPPPGRPAERWALREIFPDEAHLRGLFTAIGNRRRVAFRYRSGETPADQTRRVEPWGLGYRNGAWYLVGHDLDRRDARVYRLGRIAGEVKTVKTVRRANAAPAPESLDSFFRSAPWSFGPVQGPSVEARLLVDVSHAAALESLLPDHVPVRRLDDGRVLVRMFVRDTGAFFDWILPLAGSAHVVGPLDLRSLLAVRLETTAIAWSRA